MLPRSISSLNRPHPPRSTTPRNFPALRVVCTAFAVLAHYQSRHSASGSELSLQVPSQHVALLFPGEPVACSYPVLQQPVSPSPASPLGSALSSLHSNPLRVVLYFGVFWFAHSLQPAELLASPGGPDRMHWLGSFDSSPCTQPTEAFTPELSAESVPLLTVGYNYSGAWVPPLARLPPAGTAASLSLASLHERFPQNTSKTTPCLTATALTRRI